MSAELHALLWAVKEQPADDLPRLVLADWLEEHEDLARAEFIRAQCELARTGRDDPRRPALLAREGELRAAHAGRWVAGLKRFTRFSTFERGLLFLELSSLEAFLHPKGQAERRPEVYAWVTGLKFYLPPGRLLPRLSKQADALAGLTHLQVAVNGATEDLVRLVTSAKLQLLAHLDLTGCSIDDPVVGALRDRFGDGFRFQGLSLPPTHPDPFARRR